MPTGRVFTCRGCGWQGKHQHTDETVAETVYGGETTVLTCPDCGHLVG